MITDPWFYLCAVPAILLFGLSKSGLGAALGVVSVPIMSLAVPPLQAAAIMLPIIIIMDVFAVHAYRRDADWPTLSIVVPAGIVGVGIGWLTAAYVTDAHVRLIIGLIAVAFSLRYLVDRLISGGRGEPVPMPHRPMKGRFWGTVSGFTSFVSHSGGVPLQMYTLPLRFAPPVLAATSAVYFAVINLVKVIPYAALGQFPAENLITALVLTPLAPLSIWAGVWIVRRLPVAPFYTFMYACVLLVGLKMVHDGIVGLTGS